MNGALQMWKKKLKQIITAQNGDLITLPHIQIV